MAGPKDPDARTALVAAVLARIFCDRLASLVRRDVCQRLDAGG